MELLLLPSRATVSRRLQPTAPLRRASAATFRPSASSGNVETTTDATATTSVAKTGQEWRAGGRQGQAPFGLGLDLSEEMRRGMMWRMLAFPVAEVAAEAALLWALDSGVDAPAWAGKAGSITIISLYNQLKVADHPRRLVIAVPSCQIINRFDVFSLGHVVLTVTFNIFF